MNDWLNEIEERWARATPGPWVWREYAIETDDFREVVGADADARLWASKADKAALAAAPVDVARLIAEVKRLRGNQTTGEYYSCESGKNENGSKF